MPLLGALAWLLVSLAVVAASDSPYAPSPANAATNVSQTGELQWALPPSAGASVTCDIYFGTNPSPGPAEFAGSTARTNWPLPNLYPLTRYFWQVIPQYSSLAPGPVWEFTTRGIDHLQVSTVPSPQQVNAAFPLVVSAKDTFGVTVSNFNGSIGLAASGSVWTTYKMFPNLPWSFYTPAPATCGYRITTSTDVILTHILTFFGTKVSIWSQSRTLLATCSPNGQLGIWAEQRLDTPLTLTAGVPYYVAVYTGERSGVPSTYVQVPTDPHITNIAAFYSSGDEFPTNSMEIRPLLNVAFAVDTRGAKSFAPTNATLVNGTWSGSVAVREPASNVVVTARDEAGHVGFSPMFDVPLKNDVQIQISNSAHSVLIGGSLTSTITVSNIGPHAASNVLLTALLPRTARLIAATAAQGTISTNGPDLVFELPNLAADSATTFTFVVQPTNEVAITNEAIVFHEADPYLANNSATEVTTVTLPAVTVVDAQALEGDLADVTMPFTVRVAPAPLFRVAVPFTTIAGSAQESLDYIKQSGVLAFDAGETSKVVDVTIKGGSIYEGDEMFTLELGTATNALVSRPVAVGTIIENDPIPSISVHNAAWAEGNSGVTNIPFTVTLSAAAERRVYFDYSSLDGTATSGSDYGSVRGRGYFDPGRTNLTIVISSYCDTLPEPDEMFYLRLTSSSNALIGKSEAAGVILNDDELPAGVARFGWSAVPALQQVGIPFQAAIAAYDSHDNVVTNFDGFVALTATGGTFSASYSMLGSPTSTSSGFGSQFATYGYSFTPSTALTVTHTRTFGGVMVCLWKDDGTLLTAQPHSYQPGWTEKALLAPIQLDPGVTYRLGVYTAGSNLRLRSDGTNRFAHGKINAGWFASGEGFPSLPHTNRWAFVDLAYTVNLPQACSPRVAGPFTNGLWTGEILPLVESINAFVQAADPLGHSGSVGPLQFALADDISISVVKTQDTVAPGAVLSYSIIVSNTGPSVATAVRVTNLLSGFQLVSAKASMGVVSMTAGSVACSIGTLDANQAATINITVLAVASGTITNVASVIRGESDGWSGNNVASFVTTNALPAISINSPSGFEGFSNEQALTFVISLSTPPANDVSVDFMTQDGAAVAGSDYVGTNGTLIFRPGVTSRIITVPLLGDSTPETTEDFFVVLSNQTNATIAVSVGCGTILNDDLSGSGFDEDFEPNMDGSLWSDFSGLLGTDVVVTNSAGKYQARTRSGSAVRQLGTRRRAGLIRAPAANWPSSFTSEMVLLPIGRRWSCLLMELSWRRLQIQESRGTPWGFLPIQHFTSGGW